MGFRLVPNSVTLNDLERRNRPNGCVISPNSVAWADCVKVVEDTYTDTFCGRNVGQRMQFLTYIIYGDIGKESPKAIATNLGTPSRQRKFNE